MREVLLIVLVLLVGYIAVTAWRFYGNIKAGGKLSKEALSFERITPKADKQVLFIGDSVAFGTGANDPGNSLAGLLAKDYPNVSIQNRAINGLKTGGLLDMSNEISKENNHYDLIIITIGGNDVIRMDNLVVSFANIIKITEKLSEISDHIAMYTTGNLGESNIFPNFIKPIFYFRSKNLRNKVASLASNNSKLTYVDLFEPKQIGLDNGAKENFEAEDKLHLNKVGYEFWYSQLRANLNLDVILER